MHEAKIQLVDQMNIQMNEFFVCMWECECVLLTLYVHEGTF